MKLTQKQRDYLYTVILDWLYINTYAVCIKKYDYNLIDGNYVRADSMIYVRQIVRQDGELKTTFGYSINNLYNFIAYDGYENGIKDVRNLKLAKSKFYFEEYEGCELTTLHDYYRNCKEYYINHLESPFTYPIPNMRIGIHI